MPVCYREVEVEFDVSDLDEDEVVDACRELGYSVLKTNSGVDCLRNDMNKLVELYRNNDPMLLETLRNFLQDYTGRNL